MSDALYQEAIKALARAAHGAGRLDAPTASVRLDNPLCGDRITLDARIEAGRILALAHETRGCLLCRAAASLLAREAAGRSTEEFAATEAELAALLAGEAPAADHARTASHADPADAADVTVFAPVARHRSRHSCVMLPFRALRKLIDEA